MKYRTKIWDLGLKLDIISVLTPLVSLYPPEPVPYPNQAVSDKENLVVD